MEPIEPIAKQIENIDKKAEDLKEQIKNATDENDALKLMQELNVVESKQIRLKVNAALSDGGKSISELLSLSDADLVTELKIDDSQVAQARQMLEALGRSTGEIPLNVKIDEGQLQAILGSLTGTVEVTPELTAQPEIQDTTVKVKPIVTEQPRFKSQELNVVGNIANNSAASANGVNVTGKLNLKLGSYPRTAPSISGTANYRGNFANVGKAPTLEGIVKYKGDYSDVHGGISGNFESGTMVSVAHADGTGYNVLNYKRLSPSHAGGRVSLPADEYALTNEVGRESIVRDGVWYMLPPGPHMEHLKKGDIIFSAKQTADLLRAGKTSTYAKALSAGTLNALANGTIHAYSGWSGSGYNPWASGGYLGNGSSSIGSGASSGGGGNTTSDKAVENKIDWIEIAIKRFEILLNKLKNIAENTFNSLITRLNATNENIDATRKSIDFQAKAYERYIQEANSIGLNADIAEKVRNGDLDINTYDEATRKKIEEYEKWYTKAEDVSDAIEELKNSLAELYKSKFDNIQKDYENRLDLMQEQAEQFDTELKRLEAQGYRANSSIYQSQIKDRENRLSTMTSQLADMQKAFNDMVANKSIEEGSEAYYEMMLEIQKVKNEIANTEIEVIQLNNTIRDLQWDSFDRALESISDLNDEADFLIDILNGGKLTDEAGNLNDDGMAVLGLRAQKLDTLMAQSQKYAAEIARLDKEIAKDPMNQTLIERRKNLLELQRKSISAAKDEKEAMKELASDGFDAQLESVKKLIDAYGDSLDSAKDLYEFQKSIADKTKAIADIEKQLAAYQGDTSQETKATIQKLKADLQKANEDLQEAEYDRYISDTKDMLDELYSSYEDTLNSQLDDIDALVEKLIGTVNENSNSILSTLQSGADEVGIGLSQEIKDIWESSGSAWNVISSNADKVTDKISSVFDVVKAIYKNTCLISGENEIKSFASGGLVDYTGKANVHGSKSKPELMLNANDTQNFLKLRDVLRNADIPMVTHSIGMDTGKIAARLADIPSVSNETSYSNCGNTVIEIDHVQDYNDFVWQLQHDDKFERMIQDMTIRRVMGGGPFDKYRNKWK